MMKKTDTTELDKIREVSEDSQRIGEFLEWLAEQEISLMKSPKDKCRNCYECEECSNVLMEYLVIRREQLLANYFVIDLIKAEKERRVLLDAIRAENK